MISHSNIFEILSFLLRWYGACSDVSERAKREKAERHVIMESQRADGEKELMDFISHEIRGPVSVALAVLQNGLAEEFPSAILALQFVVELLNTHLDLSKSVAGELELAPAIIQDVAADTVAPVVKMLEPRTRSLDVTKERVKLTVVAPDEKIYAFIDPVRLKQILSNLVGNSIKFTPSPGFVEVKLELLGADAATKGSIDQLVFSVTDSGVGIAPEEQCQLFQKWHQLGKKSHQGSGVGLNLVKNLAEQMGGSVRYDSSHTGGSRFIVTIPRGDVSAAAVVSTASYSHDSARETTTFHGRYKLLIVDDVKSMREIVRHSMAKLFPQAEICVADSGEACLEIVAERGPFDVITMDCYLAPTIGSPPAMTTSNILVELNGVETTFKLRSELKETSVIVGISANAKGAEFSEAGAELFWRKPMAKTATLGQELVRHVTLPKRLRVLLLDDERTALKLLAMQFKKERKEWEVVTCTTAGEFIAKVKGGEEPFDLFILDEHLEGAKVDDSEEGAKESWTGSELANTFLPRAGRKCLVVSRSGNSGEVGQKWEVFDSQWVKGDRTSLGDQLKTLCIRSEAVVLSAGEQEMDDGVMTGGAKEVGAKEVGAKEVGAKEGGARKRKMEVEGNEVRGEEAEQTAVSVPEVLGDMLTTYCDGDIGKLEEIALIIQEGLSSTVEEVRAAAKHAAENPGKEEAARRLEAVAHKVKGTLKSVHLRAGDTAGLLQEAVRREGASEGVREVARKLVVELERLQEVLEKFLAEC
jgi:CheY-like chemotaxis protein